MKRLFAAFFSVLPIGAIAAGPTIGSNIKKISAVKSSSLSRSATPVATTAAAPLKRYPSMILKPGKPGGGSGGGTAPGFDFESALTSSAAFLKLSTDVAGIDSFLNGLPDFSTFATKDDLENAGVPSGLQSWMDNMDEWRASVELDMNGVRGKSAYEVAVENGFQGNEAQWLASLKGADGTNGTDGANGTDGTDGTDGLSAYQVWLALGNSGSEADFIAAIKGNKGDKGDPGQDGQNGIAMPDDDGIYIMNKSGGSSGWVAVGIEDEWKN